jgi:Flp pilus assembly protein CpaB
MSYRLRNILIAVALAGLAALLVTFYVSNYKSDVNHQQAVVQVLVAARDIPQNTPGVDVVSKGMVKTESVARAAVVPGIITSPDQIKRLVATQTTFAGEQITAARFGPVVQQGWPGQISGTQRAVQLAGDPNQVLAGVIQPGNYVDFDATLPGPVQGAAYNRIVIRNLKVLATQATGGPDAKISGGGAGTGQNGVLLRMTDQQSQKVVLAYTLSKQGSGAYWTLELRPGLKPLDSPASVETPITILTDGISATTLRAALGLSGVVAAVGGGH